MRHVDLEMMLGRWAREGAWVLTARQIHVLFPSESQRIFNKSVTRHLRTGLIGRITTGLYMNMQAKPPDYPAIRLIEHLRPWHFNYVSLRSAIHLYQGTFDPSHPLEVMTTGRSQTFKTPVGIIELTHTKRTGALLSEGVSFQAGIGARLADPDRAMDDLGRVYGQSGVAPR